MILFCQVNSYPGLRSFDAKGFFALKARGALKSALRAVAFVLLTLPAIAQRTITIPFPDGRASIQADIYGTGRSGIVLAHGGRFGKESWAPQARVLAQKGFTVLAVQFRGDKKNPDGSTGAQGP